MIDLQRTWVISVWLLCWGWWRISKRNAVLGLIIHLHLSKKVIRLLMFLNGVGAPDFRYG